MPGRENESARDLIVNAETQNSLQRQLELFIRHCQQHDFFSTRFIGQNAQYFINYAATHNISITVETTPDARLAVQMDYTPLLRTEDSVVVRANLAKDGKPSENDTFSATLEGIVGDLTNQDITYIQDVIKGGISRMVSAE